MADVILYYEHGLLNMLTAPSFRVRSPPMLPPIPMRRSLNSISERNENWYVSWFVEGEMLGRFIFFEFKNTRSSVADAHRHPTLQVVSTQLSETSTSDIHNQTGHFASFPGDMVPFIDR